MSLKLAILFCVGAVLVALVSIAAPSPKPSAPLPADEQLYARPDESTLKQVLNSTQYKVSCQGSTEPPFQNAYWDNHAPGIYVDIISGEPLFSSLDKFDSGTGWPSFTKPLEKDHVVSKRDFSLGMVRTEVRSKYGDGHLGHVFDDGPADRGGLRYCINSASLRFVPADKLYAEGLGKYVPTFAAQGIKTDAPDKEVATFSKLATAPQLPGVLATSATQVTFDPRKLSYDDVLTWFFASFDGTQTPAKIVAASPQQKTIAERTKRALAAKLKKPILTEVVTAN